ncbi:MAG TPA: hypothetical protein VJC01_02350 [Candidatus Paceibacterota bacterium]
MKTSRKTKKIMRFRPELFWDTNPRNIDVKKHAQYIIERVADLGRDKEARWVLDFYDKRLLKRVVTKSRCLRPRTKALWTLILKK